MKFVYNDGAMKPNMKTLIIPDIHMDTIRADKIIGFENPDEIIFLGDLFDDFPALDFHYPIALDWIKKKKVEYGDRFVAILGNHDIQYINKTWKCSGFNEGGYTFIYKQMFEMYKEGQFKVLHEAYGFIFSHAGITNQLWKMINGLKLDDINKKVLEAITKPLNKLDKIETYMLGAGRDRGGGFPFGGIFWCDSKYFIPTSGVSQVFGHTIHENPTFINNQNDINLCLDTQLEHYAVLSNGKLNIRSFGGGIVESRIVTPRNLPPK